MSEPESESALPTLADIEMWCYNRDGVRDRIARMEAEVKIYNDKILLAMAMNGLDRVTVGPYSPKIMYPDPRRAIRPEKLLAQGVSLDVIEAATESTPVAPFLKIDKLGPKKPKGEASGDDA